MMRKVPVAGFLLHCLRCGGANAMIEVRQDGVDFQCQKCGNKLLLRPGERFMMQMPNQNNPNQQPDGAPENQSTSDQIIDEKVQKELQQLDLELQQELENLQKQNVPMDDWPAKVLEAWVKKQQLGG
jgi:DNA-directed RNA polymerase subunit RPC12/RpoP